jgi:hypothetical protein
MENQALAKTLEQRSKRSDQRKRNELIREWTTKFALNAGAALDTTAIGVYTALSEEGFSDLPCKVLEAAFRKTLRTCKYWPIKVADVREHVSHAKQNAVNLEAEEAWQHVLELRRVYWNPDMPGGFSRGMPALDERTRQAARASGVFRDHDSLEALHVWAKKKFIESFIAWGELKQDEFLLHDGELRHLIADAAHKFLPPSAIYPEGRARGLVYSEELKTLGCNEPDIQRAMQAITRGAGPRSPMRSLEEQKQILRGRGFKLE